VSGAEPELVVQDVRDTQAEESSVPKGPTVRAREDDEPPLTIPEAKRRLARFLGVDPSNIKITVEA
jgi:hypothetical protein